MIRVILADQLIDGTGRPAIEDPVLILDGNYIQTITNRKEWDGQAPEGAEVTSFPGSTLLPGLIDGHVHLAFSAAETTADVLAEFMESDDMRLASMASENARRCLAGGVTTVRDCGGPGTMIQRLRDSINSGVTCGPRILASGMPITTTAGHCHFFGLRVDNSAEARKAVRQLVQDDADWIKVMATGGRMTRNSNIFRAQYTVEELTTIVTEARRLQRRVASHVLSVEGIRRSVEAGVDTLEHCNWQNQEGQPEYDELLLAEIERKGIHVSVTIVGFMRDAYLAYRRDPEGSPLSPVLEQRYGLEGDMFRRGLNAFITSDAGVPQCHFDELYLSLAVAVEWLGLEPLTALQAVTSRAATALGIDDRLGTLEPGKLADVLVVDGDPLHDVMAIGKVNSVYKNGDLVAQRGAVFPTDIRTSGGRVAPVVRHEGWVP